MGYRSLRLTGLRDGQVLGLTGFRGIGPLVLKHAPQVPRSRVSCSPGARPSGRLPSSWAPPGRGDGPAAPGALRRHHRHDARLGPVVEALASLKGGGRLVINAIRKEEGTGDRLLHLDYPAHLWLEKEIKSVANVTRADVRDFLALAA
ncbi:MAG: hypothetical protein IPI61_15005 [Syntrophaceae bacterium]|nr:hypothetical protein [Syntrophaceae bacterium]